jgi:K+-transporting ATPase ATPase C chain
MRRQLLPALGMVVVFTLLLGFAYPLVVTGFAQVAFKHEANGSLIEVDGQVVGSRWIGQTFKGADYFHPRPQVDEYQSGPGYSYGSNYGPTNETFLKGVKKAARQYREENGLAANAPVPVDAVTGSGSGLDPQISIANARLQATRIAEERGLTRKQVLALIDENTDQRSLGFLGEPGVNVLELNLALDRLKS